MMNSELVGKFHKEEIDGKQYFVYHLYNHGELVMDSIKTDNTRNNNVPSPSLFLCTRARYAIAKYDPSDDDYKRLDPENHPIFPLFWCKNNIDVDSFKLCISCFGNLSVGSDYYLCVKCDERYHKECIETPFEIKHPNHPKHSLTLHILENEEICAHCKESKSLVYHCTLCNVSIDTMCGKKPIPIKIDQPKRHDHPLTFFTRHASLDCNVCGLTNKFSPTYVCVECDFVAHGDCAYFPNVIRMSRHHHRISFVSSLLPGKWSCGVCRKSVDSDYGAYTCKKCDHYVVHSKCALRKDICDGKELEGIPEEDDIEELIDPFKRISDGIILHFSHDHYLKLEINRGVYDENKRCHACVYPIYEGDFYSCMECDFILHDACANSPLKKRHPLHLHPLTLKVTNGYDTTGHFRCTACRNPCTGFVYDCSISRDCFRLDIRCASISEPFDYQGHEHPLYMALDPGKWHPCYVCQKDKENLLNCIECDFMVCLECVTLPYMVRYKHDRHALTIGYREETSEPDWCEICETLLFSKDTRYYTCKQCCITLHIKCFLGKFPYLKPGHTINVGNGEIQILANNSFSRPTCDYCHHRCEDTLYYKKQNNIYCSVLHAIK